MNSWRQPKIRVLKLNGGTCSLLVANAESNANTRYKFCLKRSLVPIIYV